MKMSKLKFKFGKFALVPFVASLTALFGASSALAAPPLTLVDGNRVKLDRVGALGGTSSSALGTATNAGAFRTVGASAGTVAAGFGDSFLTFCLERTEYISLGTAYYVDIDTAAKGGGAGGAVAGADPLSNATAWLYTQFRNNTLDDGLWGISGFSYASAASMDSLQLAFWKLEDEVNTGTWNTIYNSADPDALLARQLVNAANSSGWTSLGNVRVMNLYSGYSSGVFSGPGQSQLYLMPTPVPEPETYAMLLAGLGLMGFMARRRRQATAS